MNKIEFCKWFYETRIGTSVDKDGVYGVQCVDSIKDFWGAIGLPNPTKPIGGDGYAYNIYTRRYELGLMDYFTEHNVAEYGDWFVWAKGSPDCPVSHVAMYVGDVDGTKGYFLGQNQDGKNSGYDVQIIRYEGSYNVLRLKEDRVPQISEGSELPTKGTFQFMYDNVRVRTAPSLSAEVVAHYNTGETVNYSGVVYAEGYAWLCYIGATSGQKRFVAAGQTNGFVLSNPYGKVI